MCVWRQLSAVCLLFVILKICKQRIRERLNQLTSGSTKHLPFFDCFLGVREIKDRESGKKEEICFTLFPGVRYEVIFKKKKLVKSNILIYIILAFWRNFFWILVISNLVDWLISTHNQAEASKTQINPWKCQNMISRVFFWK